MVDIKHILKYHAYQNIPLTFGEAYGLACYALTGCNGDRLALTQSVAAMCALHTKATYAWEYSGNNSDIPADAAQQIAGVCAAVFEQDIALSPSGFLKPRVRYAIDNCGMGGDLVVTANVSTIAAFIAAAAGIPMCKHGSPANADGGRHGSSDFIALCGINTLAAREDVEASVETLCFGYTEALDSRYKRIHRLTHELAQLPHMNDIIGPITNPLDPKILSRRIVGINHLIPPHVVARAYRILNERGVTKTEHGLFIRGFLNDRSDTGMDEVSICSGGTIVAELRDNEITIRRLSAKDFGLPLAPSEAVSPPTGMSKGDFSLKIIAGEIRGPVRDMILANAALLFYLDGRSSNLVDCLAMARETFDSGAAYERMLAVQARLPKK